MMTQHLEQHFVNLSGRQFGPNRATKLRLDHTHGRFDVVPLVVVAEEILLVEHVEVPESIPEQIPAGALCTCLERDVGISSHRFNRSQVSLAAVSLVGRELMDIECMGAGFQKSRQLRGVCALISGRQRGGDHIRCNAGQDVQLNPLLFTSNLAPFMVEPSAIAVRRKAGAIDRKVRFDSAKRTCAFFDKSLEHCCEVFTLQTSEAAVIVRNFRHEPIGFGTSDGTHRAPAGDRGVGLDAKSVDDIGQREPWSSHHLCRLFYTITESAQQLHETILFMRLGSIVGGPILAVGDPRGFRDPRLSVLVGFALDGIRHSQLMLTDDATRLMIGAATGAMLQINLVAASAALAWYFPDRTFAVCVQLDGMPLAIELAPAQIATRLSDRFRLLAGGSRSAPARHQSLQAAIDWSYDLLSVSEQLLLDRLAVFAGGWTLEAAEEVCAGQAGVTGDREQGTGIEPADVLNLLSRLVDRSLVVAEPGVGGALRYRLLETVREYATERLQRRGESGTLLARHRAWYLALGERALQDYWLRTDLPGWWERLALEQANFRAAMRFSLERGEAEAGLRLAAGLWVLWGFRGPWAEGTDWIARLVALPAAAQCLAARADALTVAGQMMFELGVEVCWSACRQARLFYGNSESFTAISLNLTCAACIGYPAICILHIGSTGVSGQFWG